MTRASVERVAIAVLMAFDWAALSAQCYWVVDAYLAQGMSLMSALTNAFSDFTIQTNLMVAVLLTATLIGPDAFVPRKLLEPDTKTAVAIYIVIVGCIYATVLRTLWNPTGLHLVVDSILHYAAPIGYFLYWLTCVPKGTLRYSSVKWWTIYPFAYLTYCTVRGYFTDFYPYPFINVPEIGYARFAVNVGGMIFLFVATGLLFVVLNRLLVKLGTAKALQV